VRFDDSKVHESQPSDKLDKYYFPEEGAGTRARFEEIKGPVNWPKIAKTSSGHYVEQVPDYIDELEGQFSFMELVSYPQLSRGTQQPADCARLKKMGIHAAVVCVSNSNDCEKLIPTDYRVVIKIVQSGGEGSNKFLITNPQECKIADALDRKTGVVKGCEVFGSATNNIVQSYDYSSDSSTFPAYLSCAQ
jgi:hypothetical protein